MQAAVLALAAAIAASAQVPPAPERWVEDHAAFLSERTRAALDAKLERYQDETKHQVVVWIGQSLDGADLADWAARTFAAWKLGRAGADDGVAIFVLAGDRQIDIEVGYGLEDRVPDATASRIIREVMAPRVRANDRDGAVVAGVDAVLAAIEGTPWQDPGAAGTTADGTTGAAGSTWIDWLALGGIALVILVVFRRHPWLAMLLLNAASSHGRGGGGRGWFGGGHGGGGGFRGGGGRSGGGGARGGW
ncbi:MAG: TPM domain-containing protein [Myxococcales bacterium]|nr:TPM domain-containing protein [Myxococcales bacterium]